jgi:hypothetical protein
MESVPNNLILTSSTTTSTTPLPIKHSIFGFGNSFFKNFIDAYNKTLGQIHPMPKGVENVSKLMEFFEKIEDFLLTHGISTTIVCICLIIIVCLLVHFFRSKKSKTSQNQSYNFDSVEPSFIEENGHEVNYHLDAASIKSTIAPSAPPLPMPKHTSMNKLLSIHKKKLSQSIR